MEVLVPTYFGLGFEIELLLLGPGLTNFLLRPDQGSFGKLCMPLSLKSTLY